MNGELLLWGAVLLACPLMMIWMMRGRSSGQGEETSPPAKGAQEGNGSSSGTDDTAELKQRIADLEAERDRERTDAAE